MSLHTASMIAVPCALFKCRVGLPLLGRRDVDDLKERPAVFTSQDERRLWAEFQQAIADADDLMVQYRSAADRARIAGLHWKVAFFAGIGGRP
jgi:hypothetical protein